MRGSLQLIRCISLTIFLLQPEDRIYVNQLEIFLVGLAIHMLNLITIDKTSSKTEHTKWGTYLFQKKNL